MEKLIFMAVMYIVYIKILYKIQKRYSSNKGLL